MKEIIACTRCARKLELPDAEFGREVQCPACGEVFRAVRQARPPTSNPPASMPSSTPPRPLDGSWPVDSASRRLDRLETAAHRGGMILTFGFLSLLPCVVVSLIFGLIASSMAQTDLKAMQAGAMNRDGESATYVGRALGWLGIVIWSVVYAFACLGSIR